MADVEWLKALAQARLGPGGLGADDPEAVRRVAKARIDEAMHALREEAEIACGVHNEHARPDRAIRVLPLAQTPRPAATAVDSGEHAGLLLLCGRAQLSLLRQGSDVGLALVETVVRMRGFTRQTVLTRRFTPCSDAFGTVVWMQDNALLMQHELIIKRLLEDLTHAACEESV